MPREPNLEDAINTYHRAMAPSFVQELLRPVIVPGVDSEGVYYLKHDAREGLVRRLAEDGVVFTAETRDQFGRNLYGAINKDPLKQAGYGMLNATLPREVARQLTPWEAVYAYVGIWANKATSSEKKMDMDALQHRTLYSIIRTLVFNGMERVKQVHNEVVAAGKYKTLMEKAPHEEEIRARMPESKVPLYNLDKYRPEQTKLF